MIPPYGRRHRPVLDESTWPFAVPRVLARLPGLHRLARVRIGGGMLDVRFGPWRVRTPMVNVRRAEVTGPFRFWTALGPRLSLVDRGLTFGTSTAAGVCIRFDRPVPGLDPFGRLRHPALTVTVADPAGLARALSPARPPAADRPEPSAVPRPGRPAAPPR